MSYKPEAGEVFFCGSCNRQQEPREGNKCKICNKTTVSWHTNRENAEVAKKRWKHINS